MIKAVRQKKRRKQRLLFVGLFVVLLAAAGGTLHRLSLSLQDISRIIQLAAGKFSDSQQNAPVEKVILRGTIYDRDFNELSVSYQLFTLFVHPVELFDRHEVAEDLARILGMDKQVLAERLNNVQPVIEIADDLDNVQAAAIADLNVDGVYCKPREERYYPAHTAAATLLGFADQGVGLAGLEALYDPILHTGEFRKKDAPDVDFAGAETLGRAAADIVLTIDLGLQKKIEQQLQAYRKKTGAAYGMGLALDPGSGEVLAMVSQPGFDPNYFWHADETMLWGQVFSPDFIRELMRPLLITSSAIYDAGLNGDVLPATIRAPGYGMTEEKLAEYWALFGFSKPVTGRFPAGKEKDPAAADNGAKAGALSGGQLAVGLASLVNGGTRVTPYFLQSVYDYAGQQTYGRDAAADKKERIIPPAEGVHLRRELLSQPFFSSNEGFLFSNRATKVSTGKGMSTYSMQEMIVAAVPRERPEVVLLMAVDYGSLFPLPAERSGKKKDKEDLAAVGRRLMPELAALSLSETAVHHPVVKNNDNYQRFLISRRLDLPTEKRRYVQVAHLMPEVTGLSLRKGLQRISSFNLKVNIKGSGRIVAQNPAPGEPLADTSDCTLTLESRI